MGREERRGTLGTFGGVFTPSILTILGLILFLRLGYVVGNAGLFRALIIIAIANLISVLTTVSLSAIATNLKVKGGGDYYLISRTLGPEFGGALGCVLFLAQSVSIAFYLIGFGEVVAAMVPGASEHLPQIIAAGAAVVLFLFAWLGADWATRLQYLIMAILLLSLASFFAGGLGNWNAETLAENWSGRGGGLSFWVLFAIFFPAVTGFTQGVSMSGDLKDPGRSLPRGTFLAVGLSIVVYLAAALVFAAGIPGQELQTDYGAMKRMARFGWLIDAGVIAATISSAMASFLGAPRILQSLAKDRLFRVLNPFAKGAGPTDNPRRGVLLSAVIAVAVIALGDLNAVAPVVSMFFLISYGLLNYATHYEALAASPSFRPRFKFFDRRLSLAGSLLCLAVMVAIDWKASLVAVSILSAMYQFLKRTAGPSRWADSQRSYHFQRLRDHLFALSGEPEHPRDWRPELLVFSRDEKRREQLLRFSSWLEGRSGLTTAVQILEGEGAKMIKLREECQTELRRHIKDSGVKAFDLVVTAPDLITGAKILLQSHGIGAVKANTIVLNWLEQRWLNEEGERRYGENLAAALRLGCNVVILDAEYGDWLALQEKPREERVIDVWWWDDATSRLMLLLAYLITRNEEWSEAKIRVLFRSAREAPEAALERMEQTLEDARIDAEPVILPELNADIVSESSREASLVMLPLRLRNCQPLGPFGDDPEDLFNRLPVVALVLAAEDIPLDAEPEDGEAGEAAARLDAADAATRKAEKAENKAARATQTAEALEAKVEKAESKEVNEEEKALLETRAAQAKEEAEKAARKSAKAKAKAEDAEREADPDGEGGNAE